MLRKGRWKYIYYAENNPDLLFDMVNDPQEIQNLSRDPQLQPVKNDMHNTLRSILDPEEVNNNALEDQSTMADKLGGLEAIRKMQSFNHTPI